MSWVSFAVALLLIVGASELFTNAIEWAGYRLKLGSGATGSLLAALGTSLPEATVPVVALVTASKNANSVAMGAVIGSPMLLLGLSMGITGIAIASRRSDPVLRVGTGPARRDLGVFAIAFAATSVLAVTAAPYAVRVPFAIALVVAYALYVRSILRDNEPGDDMPEPLHILRWDASRDDAPVAIALQLIISVAVLIFASDLFVNALDDTASVLKLPALTVAVVLVPLATELPETMNSVLWVRSKDDILAFGNISGSAVFQACLLGALGLCFTDWNVGKSGLLSMAATLVTATFLLVLMWPGRARGRWLMLAALPWVGYVAVEILSRGQL